MEEERLLDIYNFEKRLESTLKELRNPSEKSDWNNVSLANRQKIVEFQNHLYARGVSSGRVIKYIYTLKAISKMLGKDFKDATKQDIERILSMLRKAKNPRTGNTYTEYTQKDFKVVLKIFFQWLYGFSNKKYPPLVDWFTSTMKVNKTVLPENLLTPQEVNSMIKATNDPKTKAFIAVIYETAARPSEIISLRWHDVQDTDYGKTIMVRGKTGMRKLFLVFSAPYLVSWMNIHPNREKNEPYAPLWVGHRNLKQRKEDVFEPLTYAAFLKAVQRTAKEVGIKKKINLYTFRHSRLTLLSKLMKGSIVKQLAGHSPSSTTLDKVYVHLSSEDLEEAVLDMYNIKKKKVLEEEVQTVGRCPVCNVQVSPEQRYCVNCLSPLTKAASKEQMEWNKMKSDIFSDEQKIISIITDPKFQKILEGLKKKS
jgi:integrase